jgi:PTS system ascorbate-specific IIA component
VSVGLLIVSHDDVGAALFKAATSVLGMCPLQVVLISVHRGDDPERVQVEALRRIGELDSNGDGVLVLTDMYGSTPSNIASRLQNAGKVRVIAGLNLPMLVRILNYPRLGLDELVRKAVDGGREGVMTW